MKYPDLLNDQSFRENPELYVERAIKEYIATSPLNCMKEFNNQPFFAEPVVVFANGDDPVFRDLKKTLAEYHFTPREILEERTRMHPYRRRGEAIEHVSVISGALPLHPDIIHDEGQTHYGGSLRHKYSSWVGGHSGLMRTMTTHIENLLLALGHIAIAPAAAPFFEQNWDRVGETCRTTISNWSERHIAAACGLGTFGLNGQIITPKGAAVHLFSFVCDLKLPPTPKPVKENCLYYRDGSCKQCIDRCQGGAISENGRNPKKCHEYAVNKVPEILKRIGMYDDSTIGRRPACGLCFSNVPCTDRIP